MTTSSPFQWAHRRRRRSPLPPCAVRCPPRSLTAFLLLVCSSSSRSGNTLWYTSAHVRDVLYSKKRRARGRGRSAPQLALLASEPSQQEILVDGAVVGYRWRGGRRADIVVQRL